REDIFQTHEFGRVAPWVDLVNSEESDGFGHFSDRLDDPRWLDSFLRYWKIRPAGTARAPGRALKGLRLALRAITETLENKGLASAAQIAVLNDAMKVPAHPKIIGGESGYHLELSPVRKDWNWALAKIAASAAETLTTPLAQPIKICANPDCRWLFQD